MRVLKQLKVAQRERTTLEITASIWTNSRRMEEPSRLLRVAVNIKRNLRQKKSLRSLNRKRIARLKQVKARQAVARKIEILIEGWFKNIYLKSKVAIIFF